MFGWYASTRRVPKSRSKRAAPADVRDSLTTLAAILGMAGVVQLLVERRAAFAGMLFFAAGAAWLFLQGLAD